LLSLPENAIQGEKMTYRRITVHDKEIDFSIGFTDFHMQTYQYIFAGNGFGIEDKRPSIETLEAIRTNNIFRPGENVHRLLLKVMGD
jgi:UDP-N-acetyl-2-amino-2-deoxyglucuronate dehydrogenase